MFLFVVPYVPAAAQIDSMQYMFSALPDTVLPTHFIMDQSSLHDDVEGTPADPLIYDGKTPGIMPAQSFPWAYLDLYLAQRLDSNGKISGSLPPILQPYLDFVREDSIARNDVDFPIHLTWLNVQTMDPYALDSGLIQFQDGQLHLMPSNLIVDDITGATINLGDSIVRGKKAFPVQRTFFGGVFHPVLYPDYTDSTFVFRLEKNLFQSNVQNITKIEVDFADGKGFVPVTLGQKVSVRYSKNMLNSEGTTLTIRGYQSPTLFKESKFNIFVVYGAAPPDATGFTKSLDNPKCIPLPKIESNARYSIRLGKGNTKLTKPVVIVEGFESSNSAYGDITYKKVSSGEIRDFWGVAKYEHMWKLAWLYDSLESGGFDIVHLDFKDSKLGLDENAQHLLRVLKMIEDESVTYPTTVIGASMGGLISRIALNKLDQYGCCYNIAGFGSFDSPHQGAFIPIGLQAQSKALSESHTVLNWLSGGMVSNPWKKSLNSLAARSMLVEHYEPSAAQDRAIMLAQLGRDLPAGLKTFAIINGNDMGAGTWLGDAIFRYVEKRKKYHYIPAEHEVGATIQNIMFNLSGGHKDTFYTKDESSHYNHYTDRLYEKKEVSKYWAFALRYVSATRAYYAAMKYAYGTTPIGNSANMAAQIVQLQQKTNWMLDSGQYYLYKTNVYVPEASYHKDFAQLGGGIAETGKEFDQVPGLTVYSGSHCFIPSFSALNIPETFKSANVRGNMGLIPFDSYYAPGIFDDHSDPSQLHVTVDESNIQYALAQIRSIYDEIGSKGELSGSYNVAKADNAFGSHISFSGSLHVLKGAELNIATFGKIQYGAFKDPMADLDQNIQFYVGNACSSDTLLVNGLLRIGETPSAQGILVVKSGSTLRLGPSGELFVDEGSKIIVEAGAHFVIDPGAIINWNEAELVLNGELLLMPKADFIPGGSVKFSVEGGTLSARYKNEFALSPGSSLALFSSLVLPGNLQNTAFTDVNVVHHNKSTLVARGNFIAAGCSFTNAGITPHLLLRLKGSTHELNHCTFSGGDPAVIGELNADITFKFTSFSNSELGMRCYKKPLEFNGITFENCQIGAILPGGDFEVRSSSFLQCGTGMKIIGGAGNVVFFDNQFDSCTVKGIYLEDVNSQWNCNYFVQNQIGIDQRNDSLVLAPSAGNKFINNYYAIRISNLDYLDLSNGHNVFSGSIMRDITGYLSNSATLGGLNSNTLYANYNSFSSSSSVNLEKNRNPVVVSYDPTLAPNLLLCPSKTWTGKQEISASSEETAVEISIYPNPASSPQLNLKMVASTASTSVQIYTVQGQLIFSEDLSPGVTNWGTYLPVAPGAYTVRIVQGTHTFNHVWIYR